MKNDLLTPMASRGWTHTSTGGEQAGAKDGAEPVRELGAPQASTAGGPVGIQITEDIGSKPPNATMPLGTAIYANARR